MNGEQAGQWLLKAGHNLKIGKDEMAAENPVTDMVCFHMQQCAEKALKAYLIFKGTEISKTHNLAVILRQCISLDEEFNALNNLQADRLTDYAVEMRYPDEAHIPSDAETREAIRLAEQVIGLVRKRLAAAGYSA